MILHEKNNAACLLACQPDVVRSGRVCAGAMFLGASFNGGLKPITAVLTNFGLILNDLCAVWASFSRNNLRFVKFNLCVGGGHYREGYGNSRQQEAKDHPSNRAAAFATGNSGAQDTVNKTNNKYNHSTISPLVNQFREDAIKFHSRKTLLFVSAVAAQEKVKQHEIL
ncbi:hypothetical protein [Acetobacter senegalensis]|nr:hypothetical protein [Acetobacter senegalensis]